MFSFASRGFNICAIISSAVRQPTLRASSIIHLPEVAPLNIDPDQGVLRKVSPDPKQLNARLLTDQESNHDFLGFSADMSFLCRRLLGTPTEYCRLPTRSHTSQHPFFFSHRPGRWPYGYHLRVADLVHLGRYRSIVEMCDKKGLIN